MPYFRELKHGKTLLVFAIIDVVLAIVSLVVTYLLLASRRNDLTEADYNILFVAFIFTAIFTIILEVFILIAGAKSRNSKGWTIFLLVCTSLAIISAIMSFAQGQFSLPITAILIFIYSIMNIHDDGVRIDEYNKMVAEHNRKLQIAREEDYYGSE